MTRRAPRLPPGVRIAGHVTQRGRFASADTRRGRPLPRLGRWVGVLAWAAFVGEVARRAWARREDARGPAIPPDG